MSYTTAKLLLTIVHRMIVMVVTNASVTSNQIDEWAKRLSFSSEEREAREKAEAEIATWIERHDLKRDELFRAEAERDECRAAQEIHAKAIRDAKAEARAARNAALEEAADLCDRYRHPDGSSSGLAGSLADAILALIKEVK